MYYYLNLLDSHKEREGEGAADEDHGEDPDEDTYTGTTSIIIFIMSNLNILLFFTLTSFREISEVTINITRHVCMIGPVGVL